MVATRAMIAATVAFTTMAAPSPSLADSSESALPARQQEALDRFASACFDGALRTTAPVHEVQLAELPSALGDRYRAGFAGRYYRVGADRLSYLIVLTSTDPTATFASVCALAVPGGGRRALFRSAMQRLGPQWQRQPELTIATTADISAAGYVIQGVSAGGHVLLEVSHYAGHGARDSKSAAQPQPQ